MEWAPYWIRGTLQASMIAAAALKPAWNGHNREAMTDIQAAIPCRSSAETRMEWARLIPKPQKLPARVAAAALKPAWNGHIACGTKPSRGDQAPQQR